MAKYKIEGLADLQKDINLLRSGMTGIALRSARAGSTIVKRTARQYAPVGETGNLKRGIVVHKERGKKRGKAVFDIYMSPKMTHLFADERHSYYYPASMEYGYLTRNGGYIPGYYFMKRAADHSRKQFESRVIQIARKAVDKALVKQGVKL